MIERASSNRILLVLSAAVFMASLDLFIVNIAFPDIQGNFRGTTTAGLSWVLNGYAIVFAALLVPAGRIADRFGRKRAFLAGLLVFAAASALCGLAGSVPLLVAARVLQAGGAAFLMPTSLALLLAEVPAERRPVAIGIWAAAGGVAAAAGPPIGGLLVQASWRLVFLINIPVALAAAAYGARVLTESRDHSGPRLPDLAGTALLVAAIGVLSLGLVEAPTWGWGDPRTLAALAGAAIGLALFVARSARHPSPVVDLAMLRVRSFAASSGAALLFFAAFAAMLLSQVLFLTRVWHDSVLVAGLSLAPGPLMAAVFSVPAGRMAERVGQRTLAAAGGLLFALSGAWWMWRIGVRPEYAGTLLPTMLAGGTGVGLTIPSLSSAAVSELPPARFATGSAAFAMARQLGSVLGVAVLVAILGNPAPGEAVGAFRDAWVFITAASLAAGVVALSIGSRAREWLPEPSAA